MNRPEMRTGHGWQIRQEEDDSMELTNMDAAKKEPKVPPAPVKSLVIVFSFHHGNTRKIADALATVLGAPVKTPDLVTPEEIATCDLVGFGSGIYGGTFDPSILDLADRLPAAAGKPKTFLFSTYGAPEIAANPEFITGNHDEIRNILEVKGYAVLGEFGCGGWNTNSFLSYIGGINKGRPDAEDLLDAEAFALRMLAKARGQ